MPEQATPSVMDFLEFIRERKPSDANKCGLVLRKLVPILLGESPAFSGSLSPEEILSGAASRIPAHRLFDVFADDRRSWAPAILEANPDFLSVAALKTDYRAALIRCLKFAASCRFLTFADYGVSPEWQAARRSLQQYLPHTDRMVRDLLERRISDFHGYRLEEREPDAIKNYANVTLSAFNQMARHMTSIGLDSPCDVKSINIYGPGKTWLAACKTHRVSAHYWNSRFAWRVLSDLHPEWGLSTWPNPAKERNFILQDGIPLVDMMIREVFQGTDLAEITVEGITTDIRRLLGYLKNIRQFDLAAICESLDDPKDLAALLFAGYPPMDNGKESASESELQKIFHDRAYREDLIREILRVATRHESLKGTSRRNPILHSYIEWNIQRGCLVTSRIALTRFRIIGMRYLGVHETQAKWVSTMQKRLKNLKLNAPPTDYSERKETVGFQPDLWEKLIAVRHRLTAATAEIASQVEKAREGKSQTYWKIRWAVAVRDELMVSMLLCFQLRSVNIRRMKIGTDIFPDEYRIRVPGFRAKAGRRILKEFHQEGPFADLRALLDTYLYEARPILLADRPNTPYLFVARYLSEWQQSFDNEGHLVVGRRHLLDVVKKISHKFFRDVLPPKVNLFNPHLFRHVATNYFYAKEGGEMLATQALANTAGTVRDSYLASHQGSDRDVRRFIEAMDINPPRTHTGKKERTQLRSILAAKIQQRLGVAVEPGVVNEIIRLFE